MLLLIHCTKTEKIFCKYLDTPETHTQVCINIKHILLMFSFGCTELNCGFPNMIRVSFGKPPGGWLGEKLLHMYAMKSAAIYKTGNFAVNWWRILQTVVGGDEHCSFRWFRSYRGNCFTCGILLFIKWVRVFRPKSLRIPSYSQRFQVITHFCFLKLYCWMKILKAICYKFVLKQIIQYKVPNHTLYKHKPCLLWTSESCWARVMLFYLHGGEGRGLGKWCKECREQG